MKCENENCNDDGIFRQGDHVFCKKHLMEHLDIDELEFAEMFGVRCL